MSLHSWLSSDTENEDGLDNGTDNGMDNGVDALIHASRMREERSPSALSSSWSSLTQLTREAILHYLFGECVVGLGPYLTECGRRWCTDLIDGHDHRKVARVAVQALVNSMVVRAGRHVPRGKSEADCGISIPPPVRWDSGRNE